MKFHHFDGTYLLIKSNIHSYCHTSHKKTTPTFKVGAALKLHSFDQFITE